MIHGISTQDLKKILRDCNVDFENKELYGTLINACKELVPESPVDNDKLKDMEKTNDD